MGGRRGSKEVGVMGIDFERDGKRVIWIFFWRHVRASTEAFLGFCNSSWQGSYGLRYLARVVIGMRITS